MLKNMIVRTALVLVLMIGFVAAAGAMIVLTPHEQFAHVYEEKTYRH